MSIKALVFLTCVSIAHAAIPASALWEVRQNATPGNANSGGFDYGNANFANDLQCTFANTAAPVCSTASSYSFVAGNAAQWLFVQSGTNWVANQMCPIASVAAGSATLNANIGSCLQYVSGHWVPNAVVGVASVASPTGGVWGVDKTQQTAADTSYTDIVIGGTTTQVTSATTPFNASDVANSITITAGAGCTVQRVFISSVATATATLDKAAGTAASTCTGKKGGALSLASSDDAIFELAVASSSVSNIFFVKAGSTYAIGGIVSISAAGNVDYPITIEGYNSVRGDGLLNATLPLFDAGANAFTFGTAWRLKYMGYTGTGTSTIIAATNDSFLFSKVINSSTTAARPAITGATSVLYLGIEAMSYRGPAISCGAGGCRIDSSFLHSSDTCVLTSTTGAVTITDSVLADCGVTAGLSLTGASTGGIFLSGDLFYGAEGAAAYGTGVKAVTGVTNMYVKNCIFVGLTKPANITDSNNVNVADWNNTYNSGGNTNWNDGSNSYALNPQFVSVATLSGATATTVATNHLVQSGATFVASGVTPGRDVLYLVSGTGTTNTTHYSIITVNSDTDITVGETLAANATADHVWQINIGWNFAIGTNLKGLGYPGLFPGRLFTGYKDIGPVERQESGSGTQKVFGSVK